MADDHWSREKFWSSFRKSDIYGKSVFSLLTFPSSGINPAEPGAMVIASLEGADMQDLKLASDSGRPSSSMHEAGHSKPVLRDNSEGWDGEGCGRGVQDGDTCATVGDLCQCVAKTTKFIIKNKVSPN